MFWKKSKKKKVDKMEMTKVFPKQHQSSLSGIDLEKDGRIDEAIAIYEQEIQNNFEGDHPYNRLSIIYRKRKQFDEEIRVLERAVWVFKNKVSEARRRNVSGCNASECIEPRNLHRRRG